MATEGRILVTGGCGYIGSHTVVDLLENGFDVVSLDSLVRASDDVLNGIEAITGTRVENLRVDLCDLEDTRNAIRDAGPFDAVIHFAALKYVDESVREPLLYYRNNLDGLVNLLDVCSNQAIDHVVFSSSCSVYGNVDHLPVTEDTPFGTAESPYAATKQMGERILTDAVTASERMHTLILRYFNPVGAHASAHIGESPATVPNNLVPRITGTAAGRFQTLQVFGHDYPTRDGTCVRDYIHVSDIAHAHTLAVQHMLGGMDERLDVLNLGSGTGVTVLEAIRAFERVTGQALDHELTDRRAGDVVAVFADNSKARSVLGWTPTRDIDEMMRTAWAWEEGR